MAADPRHTAEQQLTAIESQLRKSDPGLEGMFEAFTRQPTLRQGPVRERLTPWRPAARAARASAKMMAVFVTLACLLVACMVAAIVLGGLHTGPAASSNGVHSSASHRPGR